MVQTADIIIASAVGQSLPSAATQEVVVITEMVGASFLVQAGPYPLLLPHAISQTVGQAWEAMAELPPSNASSRPSIPAAWPHTPSFSPFERAWPRPRSIGSDGRGRLRHWHQCPLFASASLLLCDSSLRPTRREGVSLRVYWLVAWRAG